MTPMYTPHLIQLHIGARNQSRMQVAPPRECGHPAAGRAERTIMTKHLLMSFAAAVLLASPVAAEPAQGVSPVQVACQAYFAPAAEKEGSPIDCSCVANFLTGRHGAPDAEIIVRMFAAAGNQDRAGVDHIRALVGEERLKAVFGKVGSFQDLGRAMDQACPTKKK
jgi:hypothetical protein